MEAAPLAEGQVVHLAVDQVHQEASLVEVVAAPLEEAVLLEAPLAAEVEVNLVAAQAHLVADQEALLGAHLAAEEGVN